MSQALEDATKSETPAIDRLLSYINEYRHVMEFCKERIEEYDKACDSFVNNPEEFKYWSGRLHALREILEIMGEDRKRR